MCYKIITILFLCSLYFAKSQSIFNNAIDSDFSLTPGLNPFLPLSASTSYRKSPYGGTPYRPSYLSPTAYSGGVNSVGGNNLLTRRRCPLCDSSVYGYCDDKLFHDSCCCQNPSNNPYDQLPYQCQFADCSFLHANTCYEHKLITACCCTKYLYQKRLFLKK